MRSQYAYTEGKASILHIAGFYPRNPPAPLCLRPWEEDLGAATAGRDCSKAPATERLYAPCSPPLVSPGTRIACAARRGACFLVSCLPTLEPRRKGGGGRGVPGVATYSDGRLFYLGAGKKKAGKEKKIVNLPAYVTSISFALRSGASTTQRC